MSLYRRNFTNRVCFNFDASFTGDNTIHFCIEMHGLFTEFDFNYEKRIITNCCEGFNTHTNRYNAVDLNSYNTCIVTNYGINGHSNVYITPSYNYLTNVISFSLKSYEGLDRSIDYLVDEYKLIRIDDNDDIDSYAELVLKSLYRTVKSARSIIN